MNSDLAALGGPLQAVALFLLLSVLYDRYITPIPSSPRPTIETWWWGVYVLVAPLVFGGGPSLGAPSSAVHPLLLLFATRFAVEVLVLAKDNWFFAVGGLSTADQLRPRLLGNPVVPPG